MVVMAISDVMTLNFFFMVRDEGSWLDIGTSISHFAIASLLCVFVAGLEFVSEIFISGVEIGGGGDGTKNTASKKEEKPKLNGTGSGVHASNGVRGDARIDPFEEPEGNVNGVAEE